MFGLIDSSKIAETAVHVSWSCTCASPAVLQGREKWGPRVPRTSLPDSGSTQKHSSKDPSHCRGKKVPEGLQSGRSRWMSRSERERLTRVCSEGQGPELRGEVGEILRSKCKKLNCCIYRYHPGMTTSASKQRTRTRSRLQAKCARAFYMLLHVQNTRAFRLQTAPVLAWGRRHTWVRLQYGLSLFCWNFNQLRVPFIIQLQRTVYSYLK